MAGWLPGGPSGGIRTPGGGSFWPEPPLAPPGGGLWAEEQGLIWLLLGLSSYLQIRFLMGQWLMPLKKTGTFRLEQMLMSW